MKLYNEVIIGLVRHPQLQDLDMHEISAIMEVLREALEEDTRSEEVVESSEAQEARDPPRPPKGLWFTWYPQACVIPGNLFISSGYKVANDYAAFASFMGFEQAQDSKHTPRLYILDDQSIQLRRWGDHRGIYTVSPDSITTVTLWEPES